MTFTRARRSAAILLSVVVAMGAIGLSGPPAAADSDADADPSDLVLVGSAPAGEVADRPYTWSICKQLENLPSTILVLTPYGDCSLDGSLGFVTLNGYSQDLQICNYSRYAAMHAVIDPEGPAAPIWYNDPPGGGCYNRHLGYTIRKYQGYWDGILGDWSPHLCWTCPTLDP
jgi:hypothetical protein